LLGCCYHIGCRLLVPSPPSPPQIRASNFCLVRCSPSFKQARNVSCRIEKKEMIELLLERSVCRPLVVAATMFLMQAQIFSIGYSSQW
jgi:hypothetical protein